MLFMNSEVMMKVELDLKKIKEFDAAYVPFFHIPAILRYLVRTLLIKHRTGRGTSIKSIMTQAILFGSNPKVRFPIM